MAEGLSGRCEALGSISSTTKTRVGDGILPKKEKRCHDVFPVLSHVCFGKHQARYNTLQNPADHN